MIRDKLKRSPFSDILGIEVLEIGEGVVRLRMPFSKKLTQPFGMLHGGAIVSLADSAVAKALATMINPDQKISAIEIKCNFLSPVEEGEIIAEGKIIHKGNRISVGEVNIWDDKERLVAKAMATYTITPQRGSYERSPRYEQA